MLHYSEQWNSDFTRSQLSDPKSKSVGNIRISLRSMCLRTKMYSGDWIVETIGNCKGVADIEEYNSRCYDISGNTETYAYHYFDWIDGIWRTEYFMITKKQKKL
mgnify:CR=1 FL=1